MKLILKSHVNVIYNTNNNLLQEVDNLVTMYTSYSQSKAETIKYFQFTFVAIIILLIFI